jgi:hypothetical protein
MPGGYVEKINKSVGETGGAINQMHSEAIKRITTKTN